MSCMLEIWKSFFVARWVDETLNIFFVLLEIHALSNECCRRYFIGPRNYSDPRNYSGPRNYGGPCTWISQKFLIAVVIYGYKLFSVTQNRAYHLGVQYEQYVKILIFCVHRTVFVSRGQGETTRFWRGVYGRLLQGEREQVPVVLWRENTRH